MAASIINETFAATPDVPILHFYGLELISMAKRININSLKLKGSKMDIEEWLKDTFTSDKQLILAPYHGGEAFTLETLPFEALEQICAYKPSPETSAIVGDHNAD